MQNPVFFRPLADRNRLAMAQGCPLANAELPIPDNFAALAAQTLQCPGRVRMDTAREICQFKLKEIIVPVRHQGFYLLAVFHWTHRL